MLSVDLTSYVRRSCLINGCYFRWDPVPERLVVGRFIAFARCTRPSLLRWFIHALTGCLQRHVIMLTHIPLKILQSLTACVGFIFPSMAAAQSDMPARQHVLVSGVKCHFPGLDCTKSNFLCFFWRDMLIGFTYKTISSAHLHTISINIKQSPGGLTGDKQKLEHFACC